MYGPGSLLDDMNDWCREKFGDKHGECYWRECEWDWDHWHEKTGLEAQLDKELYSNSGSRGSRPDRDKDPEAWDKWQEIGDKIIDDHFKMVEKRIDAPGDHCHWGIWTSHFVCKTGYDYGYEDYCFKNISDAVYFKLVWIEDKVSPTNLVISILPEFLTSQGRVVFFSFFSSSFFLFFLLLFSFFSSSFFLFFLKR